MYGHAELNLAPIGVSETAEAVYLAMLTSPLSDLDGIAGGLGRSATDVRAALDELADLQLVVPATNGQTVRAVGPTAGLASLMAVAEAEFAERQRRIESARLTIAAITAAHDNALRQERTIALPTADAVRARAEELAAGTMTEIITMSPAYAPLDPGVVDLADALVNLAKGGNVTRRAADRGVTIRHIYPDSQRLDPDTQLYARWLARNGGEVRTAPELPAPMMIFDQCVALLPVDGDDPARGAHEIRGSGLIAAAYALFAYVWANATPAGDPPEIDADGLDPQMRALLRMLADGHTDESAARRLGVSARTVKRRSAELMDLLSARSRFEAGVRATQRGWTGAAGPRAAPPA